MAVLVIFWAFYLGTDSANGDSKAAIFDAIMLVFWGFFLVAWHVMALREIKLDAEHDNLMKEIKNKTDDLLKDILGEAKKHSVFPHVHSEEPETPEDQKLTATLMSIIKDISGKEQPNVKQCVEVKKRFIAATGHDIIIEPNPLGLSVKIGKQPLAKKAPTRKAPVRKPVAKAPTKKPVTKKGK